MLSGPSRETGRGPSEFSLALKKIKREVGGRVETEGRVERKREAKATKWLRE